MRPQVNLCLRSLSSQTKLVEVEQKSSGKANITKQIYKNNNYKQIININNYLTVNYNFHTYNSHIYNINPL